MPESKNNFIVHRLSGTFAGASVPDSKKQVAVKKRFAYYIRYGKATIKDPDMKGAYASVAKQGRTAFNRAVTMHSSAQKSEKSIRQLSWSAH